MTEERKGFIYKLTCKSSGKIYIGQTIQTVEERWKQHIRDAYSKIRSRCINLENAIKYYGKNNFDIEIIVETIQNDLDKLEYKYIKEYDCISPKGYNLREGGNGIMSEESIEKMKKGNFKKLEYKLKDTFNNQMPKYILAFKEINKNKTLIGGYRVGDHPNGPNKSFTKSKFSLEERFEQAKKYVEFLNSIEGYFDGKKEYKNIFRRGKNGFIVRKKDQKNVFFEKTNSKVQNLKYAIEYINNNENC